MVSKKTGAQAATYLNCLKQLNIAFSKAIPPHESLLMSRKALAKLGLMGFS